MDSFNRVDERTAAALHRMQSPDMKPLLDLLTRMYAETHPMLIHKTGDELARLQGKAGFLEEFLGAIAGAASTMEKLQQK